MPHGFRGNAAKVYLQAVDYAITDAVTAHNRSPFNVGRGNVVPLPTLGFRQNERPVYPPSTANAGGSSSGTGSSDNIVVENADYESALRKIEQADYTLGTTIYAAADEIVSLCDTSFDVPLTTKEVQIIALGTKNFLSEYGDITDLAERRMRNFITNILEIG